MNFAQMKTRVRRVVGETTEADFWTDAELGDWLNEGLRRFTQAEKWPWLVTEGTGQLLTTDPTPGELSLTEGVSSYRHVNFLLSRDGRTGPWRPERVLPSEGFKLREGFYQTTVEPRWFYVTSVADTDDNGEYETVVRFLPAPSVDIDVTFQYYRTPAELEGDTDVPDLPLEYHMGPVHYAAARAWEKELNDAGKAQEQDSLFAYVMEQARSEYLGSEPDTPLVAGSVPPQPGAPIDDETWTRMRIPETLGP